MAPQGVGAALGMNRAGRLVDRIGGGRVVIAGLLMLMLGTVPFIAVSPDTSFWLLGAALVVRGLGLGFTMMPAMAAAYATIESDQVPRATPMLNVLQRVGGSLGTAVLAVVLQRQIVAELSGRGRRSGARSDPRQRARPVGRAAVDRVRAHVLVGDGDDGARADPSGGARRDRAADGARAGGGGESRARTAIGSVPDAATQRAPGRSPRPGRAPARLR